MNLQHTRKIQRTMHRLAGAATACLFVACGAPTEMAAVQSDEETALSKVVVEGGRVSTSTQLPARIQINPLVEACDNRGTHITLQGEVSIGGAKADLILSNNFKGTHQHDEEVTASLVLVPAGHSIQIPKSPPAGGAGGNPHIYLELMDENWRPITSRVYLGRCVQGLRGLDLSFLLPAALWSEVETSGCTNNPGPWIDMGGGFTLSGINARLTFQNNRQGTHKATENTTVDIVLAPSDGEIRIPKQPSRGGVGGNPHIFLGFLDGGYTALTNLAYLGRCNQLSSN